MTTAATSPSRQAPEPRGVVVLGATGSIGLSTLDVLARHPDKYRLVALTANSQIERLFELCQRFLPQIVVMSEPRAAQALEHKLQAAGLAVAVRAGREGLEAVAAHPQAQIVVAGIVGAAGLLPTLAAVRAGKQVLFANKEPLVMCGHLFIETARQTGAQLLPVDSEHNAIFQCLPDGFRAGDTPRGVRRILLTCSGGPFRLTPVEQLASVTPEQACAHPNWAMGRKISVDSATLMNKGLELIEACWLFGVRPEQIEIVIHPQSVIHSMVEYNDGSVLAQLGNPDMRTPIAHALGWPGRIESGVKSLDLLDIARLDFAAPDRARFPCLDLAYRAAQSGGTAPAILNAANEIAVQAFLDHEIGFSDIPRVIDHALSHLPAQADNSLETILADDVAARAAARQYIAAARPARVRQGAQ